MVFIFIFWVCVNNLYIPFRTGCPNLRIYVVELLAQNLRFAKINSLPMWQLAPVSSKIGCITYTNITGCNA